MESAQILQAANKYKAIFDAKGVKAERQNTALAVKPTETQALSHASWMCDAILVQLEEGAERKAERWLCFIQGVLWMTGTSAIDSMRDDNR